MKINCASFKSITHYSSVNFIFSHLHDIFWVFIEAFHQNLLFCHKICYFVINFFLHSIRFYTILFYSIRSDWFFSCIFKSIDIISCNFLLANTLLNVWIRKTNISFHVYICSIFANYFFRKFLSCFQFPSIVTFIKKKDWNIFRALAICYSVLTTNSIFLPVDIRLDNNCVSIKLKQT